MATVHFTAGRYAECVTWARNMIEKIPETPPGHFILTAALASKRLQMVIQPAWEPATRKTITDMMERAVKAGFYEKMPDEKIIYAP